MTQLPRRGLALASLLLAVSLGAAPAEPTVEKRVFVADGKPLAVVYDGAPWEAADGVLRATGADRWLLASMV